MATLKEMSQNSTSADSLNNSIIEPDVLFGEFDPWGELGYSGPLIVFCAVFIIVLNCLTIRVILAERTLKKQLTFKLLVGQAITDLGVGCTAFLYYVVFVPAEQSFGGVFGCNFFGFMMTSSCHGTIFALAIIAQSRKELIVDMTKPNEKKFLKMYVGLCWVLPFCISTYYGILTGFAPMEYHTFCNPRYTVGVFAILCLFVVPPIIFLFVTYWRVWKSIRETTNNVKGQLGNQRKKKDKQNAIRVTVVMFVMCIVVLCGYLPIVVFGIWSLASDVPPPITSERLVAIGIMFNSAISPIIYSIIIRRVRLELIRTLHLQCLLNQEDRLQTPSLTGDRRATEIAPPILKQKSRWLMEKVGLIRPLEEEKAPVLFGEDILNYEPKAKEVGSDKIRTALAPISSGAISVQSTLPSKLTAQSAPSNVSATKHIGGLPVSPISTSSLDASDMPELPDRVMYTGPPPDIDV